MVYEAYKNRVLDATKPIRVYRNLHKQGVTYSLQQSGKVVGYTHAIILRDCSCYINERQRQQVIDKQCRQVHAWVEGYLCEDQLPAPCGLFSYNPYKYGYFFDTTTLSPVQKAQYMVLGQTASYHH